MRLTSQSLSAALATGMLIVIGGAATARAQSSAVAEGVAAYEAGEFERAASTFDRAEEAGGLTHGDVVRILEHRVLVAQALGEEAVLERALLRLVTLDPSALSGAAPALVRSRDEAVARTAGAVLEIQIEHERGDDGSVRVRPRIRGDAGGLVQEMRIWARVAGDPWPDAVATTVTLPDAAPVEVEAVAEAVGPGGAVLASIGSLDAPVPLLPRGRAPEEALQPNPSDDTALHVGLVVTGGVLVAAAIAIAVIVSVTGAQPDSALGAPMVRW